jgi:4-hydroxy-3-polyprenylbenzoate decarboxylase
MTERKRVVFAITGASGSIYAQRMLEKLIQLQDQLQEIALIFSEAGKQVWNYELEAALPESNKISLFENSNFFAPPASGSAGYDAMVVVPCTAGTLGRIANGTSNDLIARSADVMLKERKPLVLVLRESPYNLIHIDNMRTVTLAGGIVFPASPSFYSKPKDINELVDTVVDRVIGMLGFDVGGYKWGDLHE